MRNLPDFTEVVGLDPTQAARLPGITRAREAAGR